VTRGSKAPPSRADKAANALVDAAIAHRKGDVAAAKRLYRKVLRAQPNHFKALRLSGALAHETGELDEAIKLLSAAVRHAPPQETGALEDLGLLFLQSGEQEKAEDALRRAVAINPTGIVALTRLGSTLITCGRSAEAVDVLARARAVAPDDPQVAYALAHAHLESSEFDAAVTAADAALELRPDDPPTLIVKGVALFQLARYPEAVAALDAAVAAMPEDANAWFHAGRARAAAGSRDAAIEAYERAATLAPDLALVFSQLANLYSAAGQPERAQEVADAFLARHPTSASLLLVKGLALRDAGHAAAADALLGLDTLVAAEPIETPSRFDDLAAFNAALERMIRSHPSLERVHTNRATRNGVQTGSLMIEPAPEMKALARAIDGRVRALKVALRAAGHGDHPWVKHAPGHWFVNAWAVVLGDQGYQLPHIHPEAWLSGVYYVATSADGMGPTHGEDGWLELGCLPDQLVAQAPQPKRRLEPRPGLLVTFPSFTCHRTLPFTGRGARISIAFDVFPAPE